MHNRFDYVVYSDITNIFEVLCEVRVFYKVQIFNLCFLFHLCCFLSHFVFYISAPYLMNHIHLFCICFQYNKFFVPYRVQFLVVYTAIYFCCLIIYTAQVNERKKQRSKKMDDYMCLVCGYMYDPAEHDDTPFDDLPADWTCPVCGVGKDQFTKA